MSKASGLMKNNVVFKIFLLLGLYALGLPIQSQVLGPSVVSTAGGSATQQGTYLAYTFGEVLVTTQKTPNYKLTQGFNQPPQIVVNGIINPNPQQLKLTAYPNPTIDELNISINKAIPTDTYVIQVFDSNGKQINLPTTNNLNTTIFNTSLLGPGQYFFRVINTTSKQASTVQITKI